eukprot:UN12267
MLWKMGMSSFETFFQDLNHTQAQSLQLTKDVLSERQKLESFVVAIRPVIAAGLATLDNLKSIEQHQKHINTNRNKYIKQHLWDVDSMDVDSMSKKKVSVSEQILVGLRKDVHAKKQECFDLISNVRCCINKLQAIALKPKYGTG